MKVKSDERTWQKETKPRSVAPFLVWRRIPAQRMSCEGECGKQGGVDTTAALCNGRVRCNENEDVGERSHASTDDCKKCHDQWEGGTAVVEKKKTRTIEKVARQRGSEEDDDGLVGREKFPLGQRGGRDAGVRVCAVELRVPAQRTRQRLSPYVHGNG
ncbi:hypothetical protein MRX96_034936 [Rhipicephalus microplus]